MQFLCNFTYINITCNLNGIENLNKFSKNHFLHKRKELKSIVWKPNKKQICNFEMWRLGHGINQTLSSYHENVYNVCRCFVTFIDKIFAYDYFPYIRWK